MPYVDSLEWLLPVDGGVKTVLVRMINDFLIQEDCTDDIAAQLAEAENLVIAAGRDTVQSNLVNVILTASGLGG